MQCYRTAPKCEMRPLVERLMRMRKQTGKLGSMGPARFETAEEFCNKQQKRRYLHLLRPKYKGAVVGIGDVHGDLLVFLGSLRMLKLIDKQGNWKGGSTLCVQTGDWMDRGGRGQSTVDTVHNWREELDVLQYATALGDQARERGGGDVVLLLGNHELMNVQGEDKYNKDKKHKWASSDMWAPGGAMALFLARNSGVVLQAGPTFFVHGGLLAGMDPDALNRQAQAFLREHTDAQNKDVKEDFVQALWDRSLTKQGNVYCIKQLTAFFEEQRVDPEEGAVVVGHTIVEPGTYCKEMLWRLDTGSSEAFGGDGGLRVFVRAHPDKWGIRQSVPGQKEEKTFFKTRK